jgi:hypothetical protein
LSSRKPLTVAGSLSGGGEPSPLQFGVYVREYVPPATSRLVQQLSLFAPQSVIPAPTDAQLGGTTSPLSPLSTPESAPLAEPEPESAPLLGSEFVPLLNPDPLALEPPFDDGIA